MTSKRYQPKGSVERRSGWTTGKSQITNSKSQKGEVNNGPSENTGDWQTCRICGGTKENVVPMQVIKGVRSRLNGQVTPNVEVCGDCVNGIRAGKQGDLAKLLSDCGFQISGDLELRVARECPETRERSLLERMAEVATVVADSPESRLRGMLTNR